MTTPLDFDRFVAAAAVTADIRMGSYQGREHIIVPVIAAVGNIAIRAMGSEGNYELVPLEELAKSVAAWSGRPVVFTHPVGDDGSLHTANSPEVLERLGLGYLFNVRLEDGKLKGDAYIDPERVAAVGAGAQAVLDRILAREMIEVSVGCRVATREINGTDSNGHPYTRAWVNISPDHLAFLAVGDLGACSNAAGCGAPRSALRAAINKEIPTMNLLQRFLSKLRIGNEESGPSDQDLRYKVFEALHAVEPAFDGVVAIYAESSTVIYSVCPNGDYMLKRRGYSLDDAGAIALAEDTEVVESQVQFVPVKTKESDSEGSGEQAAAAASAAIAPPVPSSTPPADASCACGGRRNAADNGNVKGEAQMPNTNKELAERLIACERSPFTEEDRVNLEAFPTARLAALVEQITPAKVETKVETPAPRSAEDWMKEAPAEVQAMVSRYQTEEKARHASLVGVLKGAQKTYDETRLAGMSVAQLEEVASLIGVADPRAAVSFAGRVMPESRGAEDGNPKPAPRPYDIALAQRRGETVKPDAN